MNASIHVFRNFFVFFEVFVKTLIHIPFLLNSLMKFRIVSAIQSSHGFEEGVGVGGVERLIGPHDGDEGIGVREIDDVVGVTGKHMDGLDAVAADVKFNHLVRANAALLDKGVAADDDEELPLGVVPVLTLGDAGARDIDAELPAVGRAQQFSKGTALVNVHLQGKGHFLLGQVTQVGGVEFFLDTTGGYLGHDERGGLVMVLSQQFDDAAEGDLVGDRTVAITAVGGGHDVETLKLTVQFTTFECIEHGVDKVVDIEQLK